MSRQSYAVLSGLCIVGSVVVVTVAGDDTLATALIGLAGTLAGRGTQSDEDAGDDETLSE